MKFGRRVRELRQEKRFTLRDLASEVGVGFTYLSKIENHKLDNGHRPSDGLIRRIAVALEANEEELLLLAGSVPAEIRKRFCERPEIFMAVAKLDDKQIDSLLRSGVLGGTGSESKHGALRESVA